MIKFILPIMLALYADAQGWKWLTIVGMFWLSAVALHDAGLFDDDIFK